MQFVSFHACALRVIFILCTRCKNLIVAMKLVYEHAGSGFLSDFIWDGMRYAFSLSRASVTCTYVLYIKRESFTSGSWSAACLLMLRILLFHSSCTFCPTCAWQRLGQKLCAHVMKLLSRRNSHVQYCLDQTIESDGKCNVCNLAGCRDYSAILALEVTMNMWYAFCDPPLSLTSCGNLYAALNEHGTLLQVLIWLSTLGNAQVAGRSEACRQVHQDNPSSCLWGMWAKAIHCSTCATLSY